MNGPAYRVVIDRLIISDLDLTPTQAERLRVRIAAAMERLLAQHDWSNNVAATKVPELKLPSLSLEAVPSHDHLAGALAQRLVEALPGGPENQK